MAPPSSSPSSSPKKKSVPAAKVTLPRKSIPAPLTRLKFIPQRRTAPGQRPASLAQASQPRGAPIRMTSSSSSPPKSSISAAPLSHAAATGLRKLCLVNASTTDLTAPPADPLLLPTPARPPTAVMPSSSPVKQQQEQSPPSPRRLRAAPPGPPPRSPLPSAPAHRPSIAPLPTAANSASAPVAPTAAPAPSFVNFSRPLPPRHQAAAWPERSSSLQVRPAGPIGVAVSAPAMPLIGECELVPFQQLDLEEEGRECDVGDHWPILNGPMLGMEKLLPNLPVEAAEDN